MGFRGSFWPVPGSLDQFFGLRKKYGLSTKALGLQKSSSGALASLLLGIVSAVAYITGMWPLLLGIDWQVILKALEYSHYHILIMFLTLNGFGSIVLTPISEEIMFRGFIYSYLRKNLGLIAGIVVQALVFSLLHLGEEWKRNRCHLINKPLYRGPHSGLAVRENRESSGANNVPRCN